MIPLSVSKVIEAIKKAIPIVGPEMPPDLEPTLSRMLNPPTAFIDRERFNIILSMWKIAPASPQFFKCYFDEKIDSVDSLIKGIQKFFIDALWHFGDIRRGFDVLRQLDSPEAYFKKHQFDVTEFRMRLPWALVENISAEDRGFLGYVSGQRPFKQNSALSVGETILLELENNRLAYEHLSKESLIEKLSLKISGEEFKQLETLSEIDQLKKLDLFSYANLSRNRKVIQETKSEVTKMVEKVQKLKEIGKSNQTHYLRNIEMIDVYVATSMRNDKEYVEMAELVSSVFSDPEVKDLNLRYFDPTLCYCESRIDKGIIECLLVRTAKVTIYCAQDGDTFGKDSELAATLCQGKPVIVYVPTDEKSLERNAKLDGRAKVFQEFHPLGLQVGLYDGVARGVIVVRSAEQCARILHKTLTNSLEVDVRFEDHGIVLRESETKSVVRVMTGWGELSHSFWSNFGISVDARSGVAEASPR